MHDPARIAELEAAVDAAAAEIGAFERRFAEADAALKDERRLVNDAYAIAEHALHDYLREGEPDPEPQVIEATGHAVGADAGEVA